jgi:hypothetical protein
MIGDWSHSFAATDFSSLRAHSMVQSNPASAAHEEIHRARQLAAESEIEALHKNLLRERTTNQTLQTRLQESISKSNEMYNELQLVRQQQTGGVGLPPPATIRAGAIIHHSEPFVVNDAFMADYSHEFVLPDGENFREKTRQMVKRFNTFRQNARVEVTRLKDHIVNMQSEDFTSTACNTCY